jgi:hypothetical protein
MKKYQIYSSLIFAILFVANTTSAQFNYGAKKKPATAGKDTTIAPAVAAADTTKKAVAFDPNVTIEGSKNEKESVSNLKEEHPHLLREDFCVTMTS